MLRPNAHTLHKIEDIFTAGGYTVRYEKGTFNSGFCVLENKKVVVINKFHPIDAKINSLVEILSLVNLDIANMKPEIYKLYQELTTKQEELFA